MLEQQYQNTGYPFDPSDWSSIAALFKRLEETPVAPGHFLEWLDQWNQLNISIWDIYTHLKRRAYGDTRDTEAERAYQAYIEALYSTYLGLTQSLRSRALTLQPDAPTPEHQQLWRYWHNQTSLFHPHSLPIQAAISQLVGQYRRIMRQYENTGNKPFAYWMARRDELNRLMLELIQQRRGLAQASGLPNFLAYRWRELNRLDYSVEDCQAFHRAVETSVVPVVAQLRSQHTSTQTTDGSDIQELTTTIGTILNRVDSTFGEVFQTMEGGYLDIGDRPNKAAAVEAWFFPRAGMPFIHVSSNNLGSLLHECGHAIHFYLSFRDHPSMWNYSAPEEFQEFAATNMEMLCWPFHEGAAIRRNALRYYIDALPTCVMQDAFEHWVYGEAPADVKPDDLDAKWLELKDRFTPWDTDYASQEEAMTGWQRWTWSLFRIPLYMITYPMAIVGVCQFAQEAEGDRASVIQGYKQAMSLGNTRPLSDLFRVAGVEFPFQPESVTAAADFIAQSWNDYSASSS